MRVWGYGWTNYSPELTTASKPHPLRRVARIGMALTTPAGWQAAGRRLAAIVSAPAERTGAGCSAQVTLPASMLGGTLSDEEMIRMYSRSRINLGFSTCGNTHETDERIVQVRLRDFEVPMSGGFYMVEYMEELEEFFDIGREIVCYTGKDDMVDKIGYYMKHDDARERIRRAGYERCLRDHSWHKRFEMAFQEMGLV